MSEDGPIRAIGRFAAQGGRTRQWLGVLTLWACVGVEKAGLEARLRGRLDAGTALQLLKATLAMHTQYSHSK